MRVLAVMAALLLALCTAPLATAHQNNDETIAIPEGDPAAPGQAFVDDPSIRNPHPLAIEFFTRTADPAEVRLFFTTGVPQCHGVHATVRETPEAVIVDLLGGTPPQALNQACIMLGVTGTLEVPLHAPLGERAVLAPKVDKPQ
ncbi:hypothetical protein [[Mycobacterium] burgundiense]|uniref:Uncharacterized protein n=1 Tax=[Mycobacterium] burgundiense TaxID=3064286 RepID=A0ABM9M506_9MYCO|nr:hypothetical protein [Mycolicibacterium sp. MU0053]CAJ1510256.1 hypothetical protein MU0053_004520 [Mycolicibacterium sp. MU0053]